MKRLYYIAFIISFLWLTPAMAGQSNNISYGKIDRQKLDIYTPDNAKKAPVIVHVHGGAWRIGNKRHIQAKPKAFNDQGYVFVSVEYPLLPDYPVETQAQSIADAVAWVRKNIGRYGGDPQSLTLTGHSAGAHLVTLIATDQSYLSKAETSPRIIKHVVSIDSAAFDIPWRMGVFDKEREKGKWLFNDAFGEEDPERWKKLSPFHHVSADKYIPPILFLTASSRRVSNVASLSFSMKLKTEGVRSTVVPIANRDHGSINKLMGTEGDAAFAALLDFIE